MKKINTIIGIETSCDDTGISIYNEKDGILSEYIYNQTLHEKYGGTVPELASRDHIKNILKIILITIKKKKAKIKNITAISYTKGPGLKGPLIIGTITAKTLSYNLKIPSIGVNHLDAHIMISLIFNKTIKFPCIAILVSGGHTMILKLEKYNKIILLEETSDDSIGETFDKIARALNLTPSNGKSIENEINNKIIYDIIKFIKTNKPTKKINISFSGIKTNIIKYIRTHKERKDIICHNFQREVIKIIIKRIKNILKNYNIKNIILAGGVAANKELRLVLKEFSLKFKYIFHKIPINYCTDNGLMIAFLGFIKIKEGVKDNQLNIETYENLTINQ